MNDHNDIDWLDNVLRQESAYIKDDGFTAKVMGRMPKTLQRSWVRPVVLTAAVVAGCAVTLSIIPDVAGLAHSVLTRLKQPAVYGLSLIPLALACIAASITFASEK